MQMPSTSTLVTIALVPLLAWRIHARFRKLVGRQRLTPVRPWVTLGIYGAIAVLLCWAAVGAEVVPWALLGGLVAGGMLSLYGLRITSFDVSAAGMYYTPHTGLGVSLFLLFLARIAYRVFEVYVAGTHQDMTTPDFFHSPLTLLVFGFLAGYYMAYAVGLLRYRRARLRVHGESGLRGLASDARKS